jgi:hypothetical protein
MSERRGAYGLALPGMPGQRWLGPAPAEWPEWTVVEGDAPPAESEDVAVVRSDSGRRQYIDRRTATTIFSGGPPLPEPAFVHPGLSATASVHADWSGWLTFHAGCFLDPRGGAWGVLGEREHGKSSALAWLAGAKVAVMADDLTITNGERVWAGPRCLDLRESSAEHFGLGEDVGMVGLRRRWRMDLDAAPAEADLHGWLLLSWGDEVAIREEPAGERKRHLAAGLGLAAAERHPLAWLGALARPLLVFSRPRSWDQMDRAMELLLERLAARQP